MVSDWLTRTTDWISDVLMNPWKPRSHPSSPTCPGCGDHFDVHKQMVEHFLEAHGRVEQSGRVRT